MVQARIEIVHGELDMMIARRVASYRVEPDGGSDDWRIKI